MNFKSTVLGLLLLTANATTALAKNVNDYLMPNKNLPASGYQMLLIDDSPREQYCMLKRDKLEGWREFSIKPRRNHLQGEYRGLDAYSPDYRCDEDKDLFFVHRPVYRGVEYYYFESKAQPGFCIPQGSTVQNVMTAQRCDGVTARTEAEIETFLQGKDRGESLVELQVLLPRVAYDGTLPVGITQDAKYNLAVRYKRIFLTNERGEQFRYDLSQVHGVSGIVKKNLTLSPGFVRPGETFTVRLQVDYIDETTQVLEIAQPVRVTK